MRTLVVAAGGGGDAITGSALARQLNLDEPPIVMTYAWDRLMIDPLPGPRGAADFRGLDELAPNVWEIQPTTTPIPPAGSSLPHLAEDLPSRLILIDPTGGAVGVADQIAATATHFGATDIALVDVGGDVMTDGTDPGLRSPLADQLALAACVRTGLPARVVVVAPGIDGELPGDVIRERLSSVGADQLDDLSATDIEFVRHVFTWHPSEASGLVAAAASGRRGRVEVRDAADLVDLTHATTTVYTADGYKLHTRVPAAHLTDSASLTDAERTIREQTGISELRYETEKARTRKDKPAHNATTADLDRIDRLAYEAAARGADYISIRRLSELIGSTSPETFTALSTVLRAERPSRYDASIYRTSDGLSGD